MESFFNEVPGLRPATLIDSNTGVSRKYYKILKNSFFNRKPLMTASAYVNQSFELQSSVAGEKKGRKRKSALKTIDMLSEKFVSF